MTISAGDLKFFQSANEGSAGGSMSLIQIPEGSLERIFPDTKRVALETSAVCYKKVFVVNTNPSDMLVDARIFLLVRPTSMEYVEVAIGTMDDEDGTVHQYFSPIDYAGGLQVGDMLPNTIVPVWMRRVTPAGLTPFSEMAFFQLAVQGLTT